MYWKIFSKRLEKRSCPSIKGTVFLTFQYLLGEVPCSGGGGEDISDIRAAPADIAGWGEFTPFIIRFIPNTAWLDLLQMIRAVFLVCKNQDNACAFILRPFFSNHYSMWIIASWTWCLIRKTSLFDQCGIVFSENSGKKYYWQFKDLLLLKLLVEQREDNLNKCKIFVTFISMVPVADCWHKWRKYYNESVTIIHNSSVRKLNISYSLCQ